MPKVTIPKNTHPRETRSPGHAEFRRRVSAGIRQAAERRRRAGLLSFNEVAVKTLHPVGALKRMADAGELRVISRGNRRFVPLSEVRRLKKSER
jgi:hypothetical protein